MADEDVCSDTHFWAQPDIESKKQMFRGEKRYSRSPKLKINRLDNDHVVLDEPPDDGPSVHAITTSVENHVDVSTSPVDEVLPEGESPSSFFLSINRELGSTPTSPVRRFDDSSTAESASTADTSTSSGTSKNLNDNPREGQFQSSLFKIRVGPEKELFTAHRDVLAKSPKLDAQCNGKFPEAGSRKIILEDHDPRIFVLLLEYLYRGDYYPFIGQEFDTSRSEDEDVRATQLQREGDLYCMAEYYQLNELQQLAVRKMKMLTPITFESFLSVSEHVYSNSGSSGPFRAYFREQIIETLPLVAHKEWLLDVVAKGGDLAQDLFLSGKSLPKAKTDDERIDERAVMVGWDEESLIPQFLKFQKAKDIETAFGGFVEWNIIGIHSSMRSEIYAQEACRYAPQSKPLTLSPTANFSSQSNLPSQSPSPSKQTPKPQKPTSSKQAYPTPSPSLHGDPASEAGIPPSEIHAYNSNLLSTNALLSNKNLHPTFNGLLPSPPLSLPQPPTSPAPVSETAITYLSGRLGQLNELPGLTYTQA